MIPLLNMKSPSYSQLEKLFKTQQKNTYTRYNYNLFKLNEKFREKSARIGFKNKLPYKKTGNIYLDNMLIIESCPEEKIKKNKKRINLSLKTYKEGCKNNNNYCQSDFNLALIPLREKINNRLKYKNLNSENSKSDKNYLERKSRENLKKNLNINIANSNYNISPQVAINSSKKMEDTLSDSNSLKGIMIEIKKKLKENRFNVNRMIHEFDKQMVQDQYLIERFYEMKKNLIDRNKMLKLKHNIKNKKIFYNFDKIIKSNPKN